MPGLSTNRLKLLSTMALAAIATAGCQPEVLIASSEPETAGTGGGVAGTSTGGGGAGGTSEMPPMGGDAGAAAVPEPPRLLADSVADFSLNQGEHNWFYGYDGGSLESFALMTETSTITAYMPVNDTWECWTNKTPHWTQIFQLGAHPNGTITSTPSNSLLQRAVRRWISTYNGKIRITGEIAKIDVTVNGSNGVDASVYVDGGAPIYATPIGGEDGGGLSYDVTAPVQVNSTVDFVLDPHEGDDHHDLSRFTAVIMRAEP